MRTLVRRLRKRLLGTVGLVVLLALGGCIGGQPESTGERHIRTTDPRTPDEEQTGFRLPPGFEIELFAAEPDIGKPFNLAFDAEGRMWVTQSSSYPFPAEDSVRGEDRITILEDTDGDGQADTFTDFADSLNIPIGILPVDDGAIAFSIPNLYRFYDDDGDDRADRREVLYGTFGYQDTHGMVNHLTRGYDGWIYACHGFTNQSEVTGDDGHTITMVSGNMFRFRPDGRRVETTTTGRVNPFGLVIDKFGYHYSPDSHSDPIYQLIPGGDYPHFGKQPSGIGFAPHMMDHDHGPTALAGLAFYNMTRFPPAYRRNFYQGNVVSGIIHRDSLTWRGATPSAVHRAEFLTSEDPWFRPVDVVVGPNGALYVADFYNRIIGHYEVPLDHPGRDHVRGRIWRITYQDEGGQPAEAPRIDWSTADVDALMEGLRASMLRTRMQVADQLVQRIGKRAIAPVETMTRSAAADSIPRVHGLWILHRLDALPDDLLTSATRDSVRLLRVHAMRILREHSELGASEHALVRDALDDPDPHVQRAALEALARHPRAASLEPVLTLYEQTPAYDTHLAHAARLALRNHLRDESIRRLAVARRWNEEDTHALAEAMIGVDAAEAGTFLFATMKRFQFPEEQLMTYVRHVARYLPGHDRDALVAFIRDRFAEDVDRQIALFQVVQHGAAQRGEPLQEAERTWGIALAERILGTLSASGADTWSSAPLANGNPLDNPWTVTMQDGSGDVPAARMLTSLQGGPPMARLTSPAFDVPASFSFLLAGANGAPDGQGASEPASGAYLRLMETGEVVEVARVRGGESRQRVEWDLSSHAGERAVLEVVDGTTDGHIAVGRFEPPVIGVPPVGPAAVAERQRFAAEMAGSLGASALVSVLHELLTAGWVDVRVRAASAHALMQLDPTAFAPAVQEALLDASMPVAVRAHLAEAVGRATSPERTAVLAFALRAASSHALQASLANALARTTSGADMVLQAVRSGAVPARLLTESSVQQLMLSGKPEALQRQYHALAQTLASTDESTQQLIDERLADFVRSKVSVERGAQVFSTYCAPCHQVGGQDGMIGPQLDGVGSRGTRTLAEQVLAPNLNVPEGFRMNVITLASGEVRSGLFRREEGAVLVFANTQGEEFSVSREDIAAREEASYSLMPSTFGETLSANQFHNLLGYLLSLE